MAFWHARQTEVFVILRKRCRRLDAQIFATIDNATDHGMKVDMAPILSLEQSLDPHLNMDVCILVREK